MDEERVKPRGMYAKVSCVNCTHCKRWQGMVRCSLGYFPPTPEQEIADQRFLALDCISYDPEEHT